MSLLFPVPTISIGVAHIFSLIFAFVYVSSIYLSKNSRLSFSGNTVQTLSGQARQKVYDEKWRDDPDVIKARLAALTCATFICCLIIVVIMAVFVEHFVDDAENVS